MDERGCRSFDRLRMTDKAGAERGKDERLKGWKT
jgi:hypothetical protein